MNTRTIGKVVIGIGVIMMLAYIGWIVFRVVRQPDEVAQNGLLPNPFDLVAPGRKPTTDTGVTPGGVTPNDGVTVVDIPTAPDKRLFRISTEPALGFDVIETIEQKTETNPLTGTTEISDEPVTTVRYATRDEGFVVDARIARKQIAEKRISNAFLSGLYSVDVGRYALVGQYRATGDSTSTAYSLILETPPKGKPAEPIVEKPVCKYVLGKITLGQTSRDVESIQQILIAAGDQSPFAVGIFDDVMKSALVEYQKTKKITPASGVVGVKTLAQLQEDCNILLPKPKPIETPEQVIAREQSRVAVLPRGTYSVSMLDDIRAFMLVNSNGRNRGIVRDIGTGRDTEFYTLGFVDWVAALFDSSRVLLTTRASGSAPGFAFLGGITNKTLVPVLQDIVGLATIPSPDGKYILYSSTEGGIPTLSLYELATRATTPVSMQTFAEKCAWNLDSSGFYCLVPTNMPSNYTYPDEWYKRGIDFSDTLKRYTLASEQIESLDASSEIPSAQLDVIESAITADQGLLVFRDWKTGYIWGYRLK